MTAVHSENEWSDHWKKLRQGADECLSEDDAVNAVPPEFQSPSVKDKWLKWTLNGFIPLLLYGFSVSFISTMATGYWWRRSETVWMAVLASMIGALSCVALRPLFKRSLVTSILPQFLALCLAIPLSCCGSALFLVNVRRDNFGQFAETLSSLFIEEVLRLPIFSTFLLVALALSLGLFWLRRRVAWYYPPRSHTGRVALSLLLLASPYLWYAHLLRSAEAPPEVKAFVQEQRQAQRRGASDPFWTDFADQFDFTKTDYEPDPLLIRKATTKLKSLAALPVVDKNAVAFALDGIVNETSTPLSLALASLELNALLKSRLGQWRYGGLKRLDEYLRTPGHLLSELENLEREMQRMVTNYPTFRQVWEYQLMERLDDASYQRDSKTDEKLYTPRLLQARAYRNAACLAWLDFQEHFGERLEAVIHRKEDSLESSADRKALKRFKSAVSDFYLSTPADHWLKPHNELRLVLENRLVLCRLLRAKKESGIYPDLDTLTLPEPRERWKLETLVDATGVTGHKFSDSEVEDSVFNHGIMP